MVDMQDMVEMMDMQISAYPDVHEAMETMMKCVMVLKQVEASADLDKLAIINQVYGCLAPMMDNAYLVSTVSLLVKKASVS